MKLDFGVHLNSGRNLIQLTVVT